MRYKEDHKEQTHKKIVETASREFRTQGFDGIGIARLMSLLQLTHGGFYAHFKDKEDLTIEAMSWALDESLHYMIDALERGGIRSLIEFYLSDSHRDNPSYGCPLPTLSAEEARQSITSRESFTQKYSEIVNIICKYVQGKTVEQREEKVLFMFASLTGALALARAVSDAKVSDRILATTKEHLIAFLSSE